jgi:hypothetical protein
MKRNLYQSSTAYFYRDHSHLLTSFRCLEVCLPLLINGAFAILMSSVGGVSARLGARRILTATHENGSLICKLYNWHRACDDCVRKGRASKCRCNTQQPQSYQNEMDVMKVELAAGHAAHRAQSVVLLADVGV